MDPPENIKLDDGVYYNKYMYGNKIKMANQLSDGLVEYSDGTNATEEQMAKDVTSFFNVDCRTSFRAKASKQDLKQLFI